MHKIAPKSKKKSNKHFNVAEGGIMRVAVSGDNIIGNGTQCDMLEITNMGRCLRREPC